MGGCGSIGTGRALDAVIWMPVWRDRGDGGPSDCQAIGWARLLVFLIHIVWAKLPVARWLQFVRQSVPGSAVGIPTH